MGADDPSSPLLLFSCAPLSLLDLSHLSASPIPPTLLPAAQLPWRTRGGCTTSAVWLASRGSGGQSREVEPGGGRWSGARGEGRDRGGAAGIVGMMSGASDDNERAASRARQEGSTAAARGRESSAARPPSPFGLQLPSHWPAGGWLYLDRLRRPVHVAVRDTPSTGVAVDDAVGHPRPAGRRRPPRLGGLPRCDGDHSLGMVAPP